MMTHQTWTPNHRLPIYSECLGMEDLSQAEDLVCRLINLLGSSFHNVDCAV